MDLNSRQYVVSLDMTRTGSIRESFEMRHNDDNELIIELRDSEGIIDLNASGVINATLLVTRKDKVDIPLAGTITPEGRASFKLKRASLEKQGMVEVVAQFYFANDVRISTPTLIFNVLRDPSAGAVGDEGDDRTLIEIILKDAPALLEQLQTAYDELVIQKVAFADFQEESETAFSNAQNQRITDFNADQAARDTAFEDAQTQRATDFNTSQGERTTLFNQAQTDRQTDYTTWKDAKDTELNQLASDTENSKLAADGATANANNAAAEALEAAEEATGVVAEVTAAKQSTVKNKTFANLDSRIEELEGDTFIPMKNEVVNGDFRNGTTGWEAAASTQEVLSDPALGKVVLRNTGNGAGQNVYARNTIEKSIKKGNLYYYKTLFRVTNSLCVTLQTWLRLNGNTVLFDTISAPTANVYYTQKNILSFSEDGSLSINARHNYVDTATASGKEMDVASVLFVNLTEVFGKGNEPTVEEMDRLLAKYPNSFFDGTVNLTPKLLDDLRYLMSDVQMPITNGVLNGDFSKGTESWTADSCSFVESNGVLVVSSIGIQSPRPRQTTIPIATGDVLYAKTKVKSLSSNVTRFQHRLIGSVTTGTSVLVSLESPVVGQWYEFSGLLTVTSQVGNWSYALISNLQDSTISEPILEVDNVIHLNLTQIFGKGNEPTQAQMDALLATYPNSWFDGTVNLAENKRVIPFLLKRLELKVDKAQGAWITPTLLNGATAIDAANYPIGYFKDSLGFVHLRGAVNAVPQFTTIFTLPVGYRPQPNARFVISADNNSFGNVLVSSNGSIRIDKLAGASNYLTGISFYAGL